MQDADKILFLICLSWSLIMAVFGRRKEFRLSKYFRLLYLFLIPVTLIFAENYGPTIYFIGLYIAVAVVAACFFISDRKIKIRAVLCGISFVIIVINGVYAIVNPDFRSPGYAEEFKEIFSDMKENYVLSQHKNIDWDSLYDEYLPMFKEADKKNDKSLMYTAWRKYAKSFNDGHVYMCMNNTKDDYGLGQEYAYACSGYDYGFSLVTLSDGTTVFVNVDEDSEAYRQGIREGFTITEFDGEDIDSLKDRSYVFFYEFPDRENEKFFSALFATAEGGEEAYVTYLDDSGTSNTVTVHEQGNNYQRMKDTRTKLLGFERDEDTNNNLSYYMVDDKTACLVINELDIESDVRYGDVVSTQYSGLAKMIGSQIQAIKDEGAENLIIDMRGNYGGYLEVSLRLASYFTDEELFGAYEGESTDTPGVYNKLFEADVEAGNIWGDGSIVILVNAETISAAELFIHMMKQLDNVTVIGMTKSCGSAMGVGDIEGENITMYYPDQMLLDEDMDIMIDAGEDRVMDMAPDIIIPLDKDAFVSIFENNEDYVLNYAVRYLEQ